MSTLEQLAARALARNASLPAIEFERHWYSWGDMRRLADRLHALIDASGAAEHAPVVLIPRNRPSAVAALIGLIAGRRTVRMLYAFQSATAIARDLQRMKPAVVVAANDDLSEEVQAVLRAQRGAGIAIEDMNAAALPGLGKSCTTNCHEVATEPQIEILTSGTTGPPKQFSLSYNLIAKHMVGLDRNRCSEASDPAQLPPALLFFPVGNISGIYSTLPALLKGQRAVLLERFSVAGWHDHVLRFRPAATGMPPAGVKMLLDANIPPEDLTSIRRLGTGAAPLDPAVHRAFEARYGIPILLTYGATEFGGPVAAMTDELHATWGKQKFGSVGRPLPGTKLRIVDPQTSAVLPPGTEGILEVVSPRIGPHWIRTADIALIDEDGFLFHRGRADGAIMRGGFKLLPETIERALTLHSAVAAAAVIGIADERLGQVPAAAIEVKEGVKQPAIEELESHLRQHVYATHIPVAWRFVSALPRTVSFKVDGPAVRRLFE